MIGQLARTLINIPAGADIDPKGGFIENKQPGIGPEPAGEDRFLLVAAAHVAYRQPRASRADRQLFYPVARFLLGDTPPLPAKGGGLRQRGEINIVGGGEGQDQPLMAAVARHQRHAGADRLLWRTNAPRPALEVDGAAFRRA